ncbi:hypothetical protein GWK47_012113 [Chionoecetes opilio]|uniref:Uncharacterized protein n=1 Tax=Chionoecetes opilio TaxID=41210 RepID=A0A8J4XX10_CHIOP|nr:hypothetical protein GWK47_012113 [Chionoecetes opilio]
MDFLMVTAMQPLFKLPVVRLLNPEKIDVMMLRLLFEVTEQAVLDTSEGSSPNQDIWDNFFKYNTAIPSSAVLERLFSQWADIMKAKRVSLTSDYFERLVFMKGNMDLPNMELLPEDTE